MSKKMRKTASEPVKEPTKERQPPRVIRIKPSYYSIKPPSILLRTKDEIEDDMSEEEVNE